MTKTILSGLVVLLAFSLSTALFAQDRGTADLTINGKKVEIEYGRPTLQGRDMIGRLPVGGTWRMGMNNATTLNTEASLKFGAEVIDPGKYTLTAKRVEEDKWHLVVAGDSGAKEIPLEPVAIGSPVETFTITLESKGSTAGHFKMEWGTFGAGAGFTVQ